MSAIGLASCKAENKPNADSTAARQQQAAAISAGAGAGSNYTEPTEIRKEIKDMTPDDWRQYLDQINWEDGLAVSSDVRKCDDQSESLECQLKITPVMNVKKYQYKGSHNFPTVLAKIENIGSRQGEDTYKIPKGDTAIWLVTRDYKSFLLDITKGFVIVGPKGGYPFTLCAEHAQAASEAGFKACKTVHPDSKGKSSVLGMTPEGHIHLTPPWVTCAEGCCNVDGGGPGT